MLDKDIERKSSQQALSSIINNIGNTDIKLNQNDVDELQEWCNCKDDFFYFLRHYVGMDTVGDQTFYYHTGQELLVRTLMTYHKAVCLKSRQIGITTVIRAYAVWLCIFNKNYTVGVISKTGPDATAFARKCISIIDELPSFLNPGFKKKTEQQFILKNDSLLITAAVSASQPENTLRSNPIVFLIIDEGAFVGKIDQAVSGLFPTTITIQKAAKKNGIPYGILVISTPNKTSGTGKWFFEMYKAALMNNSLDNVDNEGYRAVKLHWKDLRGVLKNDMPFGQDYYDEMCRTFNYQEDMIAQEVDCVFLPATKNGILTSPEVVEINKHIKKPCQVIKSINGDINIYDETLEETKDKRRFVIGVDTATSNGHNTFSTVEVIDYDTNDQVCEFIGKPNIYDYPEVIKSICEIFYPNIYIIAERNTIGESVVESLCRDKVYGKFCHKTVIKDPKTKAIVKQYNGLETNSKTKPLYLEAVTQFFKDNLDKIHSEKAIIQITQTEIENGRILTTPNDAIMVFAFIAYCKRNNLIRFINKITNEGDYTHRGAVADMSESQLLDYLYDKDRSVYMRNSSSIKYRDNDTWVDKLNG